RIRGITIVFDGDVGQQKGLLLFAAPYTDITDDFMTRYNQGESLTSLTCMSSVEKKVVFMDTTRFTTEIRELKTAIDALNNELEPQKAEVIKMENELTALRNNIQQYGNKDTHASRKQLEDAIGKKEKQIEETKRTYSDLGQKRLYELTQPIYDKVGRFL